MQELPDFKHFKFAPVIHLPPDYEVYDFSRGYDPDRARASEYGIGRYNERRPGMYGTELFVGGGQPVRDIHVGIDLAAPIGTPVHAFYDGKIHLVGVNPAEGDYGGTIITEHDFDGVRIWALHGHLSHASVDAKRPGEIIHRGDVIGWVGAREENGGWNPHLHFQLSRIEPKACDMPGAVNERDLEEALRTYPDPRLVLGPLYASSTSL